MSIWARLVAWLSESFPSDEQMESLPENHADIVRRINEREELGAIARRQLAEVHERRSA